MSGAGGGTQGPAITNRGTCERTMMVGAKQYVLKQSWTPHKGRGLQLRTAVFDAQSPSREVGRTYAFSDANEQALSTLALTKANDILQNRRDKYNRAAVKNGGPQTRRQKMGVICPVIAQLHPGSVGNRTRAGKFKPSADPEPSGEDDELDASPVSLSAMKAMTTDGLLEHLVSLGIPAASQLQVVCVEQRELTGGFRNGIRAAGTHGRTNEGRRIFQTILTAAAHEEMDLQGSR
ncbi:unnamed protein product [Pylaiella littoralis]